MIDQIRQLIAEGKTEEALALLAQAHPDGILLQARYNGIKGQYNKGIIDFKDWQRELNRLHSDIIDMSKNVEPQSRSPRIDTRKVFISYNHNDSMAMQAVRGYLEKNSVEVFVDIEDMQAGEKIQGFIDKAFRENSFILSIISKNSLLSGWVNKELSTAIQLNQINHKWIPVTLDKSWMEPGFTEQAIKEIDAKIALTKQRIASEVDPREYLDDLSRMLDLRGNIGGTIQNLKNLLVTDITGSLFDPGMAKVLGAIRG